MYYATAVYGDPTNRATGCSVYHTTTAGSHAATVAATLGAAEGAAVAAAEVLAVAAGAATAEVVDRGRHSNNVTCGRDLLRAPQPQPTPVHSQQLPRVSTLWSPVRGLPANRNVSAEFTRLVVPPPVSVIGPGGIPRMTNPTAPVARPAVTTSITAARLSLMAEIPHESVCVRERAVYLLEYFMAREAKAMRELCPDIIADFITWRVSPPAHSYPPPPGFERTVTIASAMNLVWAMRAHWESVGDARVQYVNADLISATAARLGANIKPECVRKTAIPLSAVVTLLRRAKGTTDWTLARDACLFVFGIVFACRPGELNVSIADLRDATTAFTFVFRSEKPRGGRAAAARLPEPRARTCAVRLLREAWNLWRPFLRTSGPVWPRRPFDSQSITTDDIRASLILRFGKPPLHAALHRRLPWSMRATAATWLWEAGMSPDQIRFWGRWSSEVEVMYVVLSPKGQSTFLRPAELLLVREFTLGTGE